MKEFVVFKNLLNGKRLSFKISLISIRKIAIVLLFFLICLSSIQCTSSPMHGYLYNNTKHHVFPLASGVRQLQSHAILISGKSCSVGSSILFSIFYYGGGASIEEAAQKAGIEKIAVVDRESISLVYGIFYQECIVVWGE